MSSSIPPLPPNYRLHDGYPAVSDYLHLRAASGLTPKTKAQATAVAQGSWYGCYVTFEDESSGTSTPVGMGRIIGDGGWYFHIADMAVLPDHQRKGLGDIILKTLLAKIRSEAPEGKPYVNLLADPPGRKLYAKNGFVESAPKELGMMMVMDRDAASK
ncbi:GNAT family N-acetyltransferase [Aspergillus novofumigatus IBT 16806]|uniref:Putative GNAT family acetyltransferase n=1 Tax=Aspergillus novofumigatus (strain IBT 16806) TaxID=1392255 RepID=A0A2I1BVD3_ASPN1|nr:putative GNAT family acetyltransferase [Aspergillus novofumigatus IBT 16806]PKX89271.1 putative GNAT family acetyltransferase [Aspergillus novofumigatus IBT 16806]